MSTSKGQEKREFIMEKAKEIFVQKGYAATSMEDIVQYSGVSKGSIYYHFESKEDLFISMIEKNSNDWLADWLKKENGYTTFLEKLYGIAEHFTEDFQNPLMKISEEFYLSQPAQGAEVVDRLLKSLKINEQLITKIFSEGIDQGILKDDCAEQMATVFCGLLYGLSVSYYNVELTELKTMYKKATDIFLHGTAV